MALNELVYDVEDKPKFSKLLVFAFQQVLAVLAATIAVPTIIGLPADIPAAILGGGLGTLVYLCFTKFKSPVVISSSFAFLGALANALAFGYMGIALGALFSGLVYIIIGVVGEDTIQSVISNKPFIGGMISGLIGLIPNCAGSVVITELFLNVVISFGVALSGLLAGSGVGILVLFRVNDDIKENIKILLITYIVSVIVGFIVGLVF